MTPATNRLAIALVISVALNLVLFGFMAARSLGRGAERCEERRGRHGHFLGPRAFMRDGDPQVEQAMVRVIERRGPALRSQRDKLRATRGRVAAAFEAEPFDAAALTRALEELRARTSESQRLMHEALIDAAPSLTAEQRARLAHRALDHTPGAAKRGR